MTLLSILLTILPLTAWAQFKMPEGVKVVVKPGQNFTFDAESGVFLDSKGKAFMPPPGSYEFNLPPDKNAAAKSKPNDAGFGNNSSSAAQMALGGKIKSPSTVSDGGDPGGVSNYAPPKAAGSITSSTVNHPGVNMDRVKVSQQKPLSLMTDVPTAKKEISASSQQELDELKNVLQGNIDKVRQFQMALQKKKMTPIEYQLRIDNEILPTISQLQAKIQQRKNTVRNNSYYVGVLNEQLDICDKLKLALRTQLRSISSTLPTPNTLNSQLAVLEKRILLVAVKYQVMSTY